MSGTLSSAKSFICAAHRDEDGALHGHTWTVWASWIYDGESIVDRKLVLERVCRTLDHKVLPDHVSRAEDMAGHIGDLVGAVKVEISREAEGMRAEWTA